MIIKNGFDSNNKGYTEANMFDDLYETYLPSNPMFLSDINSEVWDNNAKYCMKIDVTNVDKYPDFGHLVDFGAYYDYDNEMFWWKDNDIQRIKLQSLRDYVMHHNGEIYAQDFDGDTSYEVLGTFCIDGNELTRDMVVDVKSK